MATRVRISTLAPPAPVVDQGKDMDKAVDDIIEFWRNQVENVLPDKPDLVLLPEACDRPAGWNGKQARKFFQARGDRVRDALVKIASENRCYVAYSSKFQEEDKSWRNSTVIIDRSGGVAGRYNKNHVTIPECEEAGCLYGKKAPLIECDFGKVACAICFDLNFDLLRNKYVRSRPDLVLFSSVYHGGLMQAYWAYSCRSHFVAAVSGRPSAVLSPTGETLATTTNYTPFATATVNLDCELVHLDFNGEKLRALKKRHGPGVRIDDPGHLGAVLVSCESDETTVRDMIEKFGIERLDDYFERCLEHRNGPGRIEP